MPARVLASLVRARAREVAREMTKVKAPKEETVHDLRVATRRLLALLDLSACLGAKPPKKLVRRLERVLASLSPLRDAEVQIETAKALALVDPRAQALEPLFRKRHERACGRSVSSLAKIRPRSIAKETEQVLDSLAAFTDPGATEVATTALAGEVARAYVRYERRRLAVAAEDERTLHRMRVAFKHYRYTSEALVEVLSGTAHGNLKAMKAFQDALGALHDEQVLLETLRSFKKELGGRSARQLDELRRERAREHARALGAFVAGLERTAPRFSHALQNGKPSA